MIHRYSGLLGVIANCQTCDWSAESRNAMGISAQHAEKYQHDVTVEQTISVAYYVAGGPGHQRQEAAIANPDRPPHEL